ncbi:MAG TPA: hypothetical protein VMS31_14130 [Pyrinomonadaceae bacterium]|nr:hypothetical protein [Pyrinomonadaceae bacterium]
MTVGLKVGSSLRWLFGSGRAVWMGEGFWTLTLKALAIPAQGYALATLGALVDFRRT